MQYCEQWKIWYSTSFKRWVNWVQELSIGMDKVTQLIGSQPGQHCLLWLSKQFPHPGKVPTAGAPPGFISKAAFPHRAPPPHHRCGKLCCEPCIFFDTLCSWRNTPNYCGCVLRDCNVSWHFQDVSFFEKGISTRRVEQLIFQTRKLSFALLGAGEAWRHCLVSDWRSPHGHVWLLSFSKIFGWKRANVCTHFPHSHTCTHFTSCTLILFQALPYSQFLSGNESSPLPLGAS